MQKQMNGTSRKLAYLFGKVELKRTHPEDRLIVLKLDLNKRTPVRPGVQVVSNFVNA